MSCPKALSQITKAIDSHVVATVPSVKSEIAPGLEVYGPCLCCYVIRLIGYGFFAGVAITSAIQWGIKYGM
jgi:hypothetical protein